MRFGYQKTNLDEYGYKVYKVSGRTNDIRPQNIVTYFVSLFLRQRLRGIFLSFVLLRFVQTVCLRLMVHVQMCLLATEAFAFNFTLPETTTANQTVFDIHLGRSNG